MSQAGIINTESGPPPPPVPTSFVTDINSPAIPALNVLDVFGGTVTTNNTKGIQTDGSSGGNILTVELTNRNSISSTTSDGGGQTQTVGLISMTNGTAVSFTALVVGYDAANNLGVGGETVGVARCAGGTAFVIGTNDTFDESDVVLDTSDWEIISISNAIGIQFVGVAGHTINWRCLFEFTQAP